MIDNKASVSSSQNDSYSAPTPDNNNYSPTRLLTTAMRKRRSLMNTKNPDLRVELLIGATIKRLCKYIGEQQASSNNSSSRSHRHRSHRKRSRKFDDDDVITDQSACGNFSDQSSCDVFSDQNDDDSNLSLAAESPSKIRKRHSSFRDDRRDGNGKEEDNFMDTGGASLKTRPIVVPYPENEEHHDHHGKAYANDYDFSSGDAVSGSSGGGIVAVAADHGTDRGISNDSRTVKNHDHVDDDNDDDPFGLDAFFASIRSSTNRGNGNGTNLRRSASSCA